ncbi:hypothetical protein [Brevibacterium daeguense]|uniref:hypothetical protein n=1 Tax=Brevibacterium daeguense TaxID=909936 RepID=UPI0031E0C2E8
MSVIDFLSCCWFPKRCPFGPQVPLGSLVAVDSHVRTAARSKNLNERTSSLNGAQLVFGCDEHIVGHPAQGRRRR